MIKRFFILIPVLLSFAQCLLANDILVAFGQTNTGAPDWFYKGGGTNLDGTNWKDLSYAASDWLLSKSAFGFGTNPPVRNTNIPEDATAGGGGISGARYPTLYFRKTINIASLQGYTSFQVRTKFDDAIVIWINGTEAYRNNIAAAPSYSTLATAAITNNGADMYTAIISSSLFVTGNNIIAVEIHQNAVTSSDLFFDMELTGITSDLLINFGLTNATAPDWIYKGGGTNLDGVNWKDLSYTASDWLTAKSAFGFGTNPPARNTNIPEDASPGGGGISGARYPTLYFRKIINIPSPGKYTSYQIRTKFDDGIVIWINGTEAYRNNIAASPAYSTLATGAIANNGADIYTAAVSPSLFIAGNNIVAVEIHQNAVTSSDLYFDMELIAGNSNASLTRGPYLQVGGKDSITIRWRTDVATDSKVKWGTVYGNYTDSIITDIVTTEHIVRIGTLQPDTKYFYTVGSSASLLQSDNNNMFTTLPPTDTRRKLRFVALGDCGNNSFNQVSVKNSFKTFIGNKDVDAMLLLGDNAYESGLDTEFQTNFFDVYKDDLLKYYKLYPTPGNHDYGNSTANTGRRDLAYHTIFSVPKNGELGGVPSGTTAYFSFDVGDVHLISLDSYGKEDANTTLMYDTAGAQATWLKKDLAANTRKWVVAYFHHPPYTKSSHNSDTEMDLVAIREKFIQILENYGVDLVLCGHSHAYERSYLLKGFYNNFGSPLLDADFRFDQHTATGNEQNARYDGSANSCAYHYNSGKYKHGSVYVVSGSAGKVDKVTKAGYPQDCMYYSNIFHGGCFYFEVDSNRLDAKFISYDSSAPSIPVLRDSFTVFKDVNKISRITVLKDTPVTLTASWKGRYNWPDNGNVKTKSVDLQTSTAGRYVYSVNDDYNCISDSFYVTVVSPDVKLCMPVSNTVLLSNLTGNSYQWQMNAGSGYVNITANGNYSGVNDKILSLSDIPSSCTGYKYRCVVDGKNSIEFELRFTNTWLGIYSTSWENPANWSCGVLPDEYTDVIINTGTVLLSSDASVRSIKAGSGVVFTIAENYKLSTK